MAKIKTNKKEPFPPEEEREEKAREVSGEETTLEEDVQKEETETDETTGDVLEDKYQELMNAHLRQAADFENYKKRNATAISDSYREGMVVALKEFLKVMDNMERAMAVAAEAESTAIADGIRMSMDSFMKAFEKEGLSKIESDGVPFDPNLHNAVMQESAEEAEKKGLVAKTLETGYMLGNKVLRYSLVAVYS